MEFVAYGEGEGDGSSSESMDTGLGQMSEKVQAIAQSLYIELEGMVRQFGPEPAQTVTPFLVRLLETLDEEIKQRRQCAAELELANKIQDSDERIQLDQDKAVMADDLERDKLASQNTPAVSYEQVRNI